MKRIRVVVCTLILAAAATPAAAAGVVRWVSTNGVVTWEPTHNDDTTSAGLAQVYEGLTLTDADLTLHPALATDWALVRPDLWRFHLRPGVHFHDGALLTAADVAFSLNRTRAEGSDNAVYLTSITAVSAAADDVVEIVTRGPDLLLPVRLRRMSILSKGWAERNGVALPARSGDTSAYTFAHENGTGPFMLESFEPGGRTVLVKNPDWWGSKQYPHGIDRIVWTAEPDPEQRLKLLLGGEADFLQDPPRDRLDLLKDVSGVRLVRMSLLSTVFLGFDQGSAELRTSDVKGENPFADRRVREAVYRAIDAGALVARAQSGLGELAGMIATAGTNGYDPELDQRLPYDPGRARALLAEAGYPDGLAVRLDCAPHRREVCLEVAAQLAAVGVRATPDIQPFAMWRQRVTDRETDFYLSADGAGMTLDSTEVLRDLFYRPHPSWLLVPGYADPTLDMLLERIDGEVSSPIRDALLEQAWRRVLDDIAVIPLYHPVVVWAMRDTLDLRPHALAWPLFRQARLTALH